MRVEDYLYGAGATPESSLFQDGVDEILGETEGIDLGILGNVLDPAGLFKTHDAPQPGQPASSGGGGLLGGGGLGGILGSITGGIGQALGMGGANNPLGSLFGAGIGGVTPGTGPLPGGLGAMAQGLFGQPGIPPVGQALQQAAPIDYGQIAGHTEKAGRAIVRRILGGINPPIGQIRNLLTDRRNQIQATAEHRQLNAAADAHRDVMGYLGGLMQAAPGRRFWRA